MIFFAITNNVGATTDIDKPQVFEFLVGTYNGEMRRNERLAAKSLGTCSVLQDPDPEDMLRLIEIVDVKFESVPPETDAYKLIMLFEHALFRVLGEVIYHKENVAGVMTISECIELYAQNKAVVVATFESAEEYSKITNVNDLLSKISAPEVIQKQLTAV